MGSALCILVPTFYRLNTPPITIHYCPTGCQDGEGGEGDQSKAAEDVGGGFANSDTIDPAGAGGDPAKPGATDGGASPGVEAGKIVLQNEDGTLTNANKAVIDENKFTQYLLNPDHPIGQNKAIVYKSALGYDQSNYQSLIDQIQQGVVDNPAVLRQVTQYGTQFRVTMSITGPNGNVRSVETGWIFLNGEDFPRFVNALLT